MSFKHSLDLGETEVLELLTAAQQSKDAFLLPSCELPESLPFSSELQLYAPTVWYVNYRNPNSRVSRCHQLLVAAGDEGMNLDELENATGLIRGRQLSPAIRSIYFQNRGPPLALVVGYSSKHIEVAAANYADLIAHQLRAKYTYTRALYLKSWIIKQQEAGRFDPKFLSVVRKSMPTRLIGNSLCPRASPELARSFLKSFDFDSAPT